MGSTNLNLDNVEEHENEDRNDNNRCYRGNVGG
jgi:hypothetical protein